MNIVNEYFELIKDNMLYFSFDNKQYVIDINNKKMIINNNLIKQNFNLFDRIILFESDALIIKSNPDLLTIIPSIINEGEVIQTKNLSARSFTLDSNFLINRLNYLASNRLELSYFKKYVVAYELRGLDINYQELLYLLKNNYVKYFQFKVNNILLTKINNIIQICSEDNNKNNFNAYEAYSYYLNIEDFFSIYKNIINEDLLTLINDRSQHINSEFYSKAIKSKNVMVALLSFDKNIIYKYQDELYYNQI